MIKLSEVRPDEDRILDPFILIGETIELDENLSLPLRLADNIFLNRASGKYLEIIKNRLLPFFYLNGHNLISHETIMKATDQVGAQSIELRPEHDWQYWIVLHTNFYVEQNLEISLELSESNLTPILSVFGSHGSSFSLDPQVASSFYQSNYCNPIRTFDLNSIVDIFDVKNLLEAFDPQKIKFPFIEKAILDFIGLKALPPRSPFIVVGMFSIIELLITSSSKSSPTISHQIRTKIPLLIRRFKIPLVFTDFFKGPDTLTLERILEKLYQYRSDIAHGNMLSFESSLQVLNSHETTVLFLKILLRRLLRQCLIEPQFIEDLKSC